MLSELLNSPQGQGLLATAFGMAASARRGAPWNTLGAGGLAGLTAMTNAQDRNTHRERETMQLDYMRQQMEQAARDRALKNELRDLPAQFMRGPLQTVLSNGQGPTMANAASLDTAQPSFDTQGWLNARMAKDPEGTLELKSKLSKETPFGKINPADYSPESVSQFVRTGNYAALVPARKRDVVNGQVVDLYSAQPGQRVDDLDPNKPFNLVGGQVVANDPFQKFALSKARASASNVSVQPKIELKTGESLAGQVGPMLKVSREGAMAGLKLVDSAGRILDAAERGNLYAGPTANVRLQVAQLGDLLGIAGKGTAEKITNTRAVIRGMAEQAVAARSQLGGQAQISNSEQELLNKATSGDIADLTHAELVQIAQLNDTLGRQLYAQHDDQVRTLSNDPTLQGLTKFYAVPPMPAARPRRAKAADPNAQALQDAARAELRRRAGGQ